MKKRTKLIILIASATALLCLVTALILFAVFKDSYLEELPYDNVGETAYENVGMEVILERRKGEWFALVLKHRP